MTGEHGFINWSTPTSLDPNTHTQTRGTAPPLVLHHRPVTSSPAWGVHAPGPAAPRGVQSCGGTAPRLRRDPPGCWKSTCPQGGSEVPEEVRLLTGTFWPLNLSRCSHGPVVLQRYLFSSHYTNTLGATTTFWYTRWTCQAMHRWFFFRFSCSSLEAGS